MISSLFENKYVNIGEEEFDAVLETLKSGQLSGTAAVVADYEEDLRSHFGVEHAVAVSSGTAALHAVLYAYGVGHGDEVILPPVAPVMSVLPIIAVGATPIFVDIEQSGFGLDLDALIRAVSPRTRLVMTVPMWGYPTNVIDQRHVLAARGIPLIEDASHAHGMRESRDLFAGTVGETGFFSTQERKLVSTGEGGFILTHSDNVARRLREVRDFGKIDLHNPTLAHLAGQYGHLFGLNFRISAASAALGRVQLRRLDDKIARRTQNATTLQNALAGIAPGLSPHPTSFEGKPNYYAMVMRSLADTENRRLGQQLFERRVISDIYRFGGVPLNEMPAFRSRATGSTPNAQRALSTFITLPTHEGLTQEDLEHIASAVADSLEALD